MSIHSLMAGLPMGPMSNWAHSQLETALTAAMVKLATQAETVKTQEAELTWLRRQIEQYLVAEAARMPTLPAPAPDGCACDDEKTAETNWLAVAEGD